MRRGAVSTALFALLVALCGFIAPYAGAQGHTLSVDPARIIGPISPLVYGVNYGPWGVLSPDASQRVLEAGIRFLRYPGGEWGDNYDLNSSHLDSIYMPLVRRLGAEASLSVRLKGGTPQKAAELVRYMNIEKGYGIKYWSIGNEPDLYPNYSAEQHAKDWRAYALAMRAVDPTIRLLGPEISQYPPTDNAGEYLEARRAWLQAFLAANGDLVDVITVHRYPFPVGRNATTPTKAQAAAAAREWDYILPNIRAISREIVGRELPIGITEVNSHWNKDINGPATADSAYNAIWWADSLNRLIRNRTEMVNFFALYSNNIETGPFGLLSRFDVRPTFYVYPLFKQFGETLLESASADPDMSITAARRTDGALTLMIVNTASVSKPIRLEIAGEKAATAQRFWIETAHKGILLGEIDLANGEIDLPAESATLLVLLKP
jgi:hypothetical protein